MAIAFAHDGVLHIVLDEENIERIQANDPFEFNSQYALVPLTITVPLRVSISFAKKDEYESFKAMSEKEILTHLYRGYRFSDTDRQRLDHAARAGYPVLGTDIDKGA